jgi:hypothetical protein
VKVLNTNDIDQVSGGKWDWSDISGSIGYNIGYAAGWYYENVLIGDPW